MLALRATACAGRAAPASPTATRRRAARASLFERGVPLWLRSPLVALVRRDGRVAGAIVRRDGADVEVSPVAASCSRAAGSRDDCAGRALSARRGRRTTSRSRRREHRHGIRAARASARLHRGYPQPAARTPVSLAPRADGLSSPYQHFIDRCKPGYIAVDRRGRRFANEADSYHDFMRAVRGVRSGRRGRSPSASTARFGARHRRRAAGAGALGPHRSGYLTRADTSGARAGSRRRSSRLVAQLERYNRDAERGEDPEFGKGTNAYHRFGGDPSHGPNPNIAPIVTPPYYAVKLVPGDLGTFIGLATDPLARVLDLNEEPIPGLYAVGNDQASVMGGTSRRGHHHRPRYIRRISPRGPRRRHPA
jgi:hypothetical protein